MQQQQQQAAVAMETVSASLRRSGVDGWEGGGLCHKMNEPH